MASPTGVMDHLAAFSYGLAYDAVVRGFQPWEDLLDEIAARIARATPPGIDPRRVRILDVACGTGILARRLAREGYDVVGLDTVGRLVEIARETPASRLDDRLIFHHLDVAQAPAPGGARFDVLVSLHTLYWHPEPERFLTGCRVALRPGGHALFLTYGRPARVLRTLRDVAQQRGWSDGVRALRWLLPTAAFEALRSGRRRYLSAQELRALLSEAGFSVLDLSRTFLGQISLLAWTQAP
jgi:2-polyprenyl-3-methyl-5-hydroxy-6-metoxy-1,4-benzoquinol methylase